MVADCILPVPEAMLRTLAARAAATWPQNLE
jgi:hypothetical protein